MCKGVDCLTCQTPCAEEANFLIDSAPTVGDIGGALGDPQPDRGIVLALIENSRKRDALKKRVSIHA